MAGAIRCDQAGMVAKEVPATEAGPVTGPALVASGSTFATMPAWSQRIAPAANLPTQTGPGRARA